MKYQDNEYTTGCCIHTSIHIIAENRRNGRILHANSAACSFYGYTSQTICMKTLEDLRISHKGQMTSVMLYTDVYLETHMTADGSLHHVAVHQSSLGPVCGIDVIFLTVLDLTPLHEAQKSLHDAVDHFSSAEITEKRGVWAAEPEFTRILHVSTVFKEIWGYDSKTLCGNPQLFFDAVHEHDRPHVKRLCLAEHPEEIEFRVRQADGSDTWMRCACSPVRDDSGVILWYIGCVEEVKEKTLLSKHHYKSSVNYQKMYECMHITTETAEEFLRTDRTEVQTAVSRMLERSGKFLSMDRSWILLCSRDGTEVYQHLSWVKDRSVYSPWNEGNTPKQVMPRLLKRVMGQTTVLIEDIAQADQEEVQEMDLLGCSSLFLVPILQKRSCIGILGYDSAQPRIYQYHTFLHSLSDMLGSLFRRTSMEKAVIQAKKQAEKALNERMYFFSHITHELRTPLNGIVGSAELLKNSGLNDYQLRHAETMVSTADMMHKIADDILDHAKLEHGMMTLDPFETDIFTLVEQAAEIFSYQTSAKGIELLIHIAPGVPQYVTADPLRLKQVLINLLGNAVKFTSSGEVELSVICSKENSTHAQITFSIRDTGIGISEDRKQHLFSSFTQAECSTARKFGGTGLGLAISDYLVRNMGGVIFVSSEVGMGSEFSFTLNLPYTQETENRKNTLKKYQTALVIDENKRFREIIHEQLIFWGVKTVSKACCSSIPDTFSADLLILGCPNMSSRQSMLKNTTCELMQQVRKCICMVRPGEAEAASASFKGKQAEVLEKPITPHKLYRLIAESHVSSFPVSSNNEEEGEEKVLFSPKILVAEDVTINMLVITRQIQLIFPKAEILQAETGRQALTLYDAHNIDLCLLDIQLPDMNGKELAHILRKRNTSSQEHMPIIGLTAGSVLSYEYNDFVFDEILTKPLKIDPLKKQLYRSLGYEKD